MSTQALPRCATLNRVRSSVACLLLCVGPLCAGCGTSPSASQARSVPLAPPPEDRVEPAQLPYVSSLPWPPTAAPMQQLVLGCAHGCALDGAGAVSCWGRNQFGELADGTTTDRATPAVVGGLPPIAELAAGCASTCARAASGEVWCWGGGDLGEMGDGDRSGHRTHPVRVPGVAARALTSSGFAYCAVTDGAGHATCWGNVAHAAGAPFASALDETRPFAITVPFAAAPRLVASSVSRACTLGREGEVLCWGAREVLNVSFAPIDPAAPVTGLDHARDLDGGAFLTCASDAQGVACWGVGTQAFGLGAEPPAVARIADMPAEGALAVGDDFVCAASRGETRCAGYGLLVDPAGHVHPLSARGSRLAVLDGTHGIVAGPGLVCALDASDHARCAAWLSGHEGEPAPPPS